jgi:hypothetical protein
MTLLCRMMRGRRKPPAADPGRVAGAQNEGGYTVRRGAPRHPDAPLSARRPLQRGEQLDERATRQLADIGRRPTLVRSFFRHPSVAYITNL